MSIYKLFGNATGGTEDSVANLDIQFDGTITAMLLSMNCDLDADGEHTRCEVSFLSSNTITANDARGSLISGGIQMSLTTSGIMPGAVNNSVSGVAIPVTAGERVHMHFVGTAGATAGCHVYIYVDDGAATGLRRRR